MIARVAAVAVHTAVLAIAAWLGGGSGWIVVALVGWQLVESAVAHDRIDTADTSARAIGAVVLAVVLAALLAPGEAQPAWLVVVAVGVGLRGWAIATLGPQFLDGVALLPNHVYVTTGPYRWLRHPADAGLLAVCVGVTSAAGSLVAAAITGFVLVPLLWWRTRAEDELLGA